MATANVLTLCWDHCIASSRSQLTLTAENHQVSVSQGQRDNVAPLVQQTKKDVQGLASHREDTVSNVTMTITKKHVTMSPHVLEHISGMLLYLKWVWSLACCKILTNRSTWSSRNIIKYTKLSRKNSTFIDSAPKLGKICQDILITAFQWCKHALRSIATLTKKTSVFFGSVFFKV